jgi:hypothetical protein
MSSRASVGVGASCCDLPMGQRRRIGDANSDADVDDGGADSDEAMALTAAAIREASRNLSARGALVGYERRLAVRELRHLLGEATARDARPPLALRSSHVPSGGSVSDGDRGGGEHSSEARVVVEFNTLRGELQRVLARVERDEAAAAAMCARIQRAWRVVHGGADDGDAGGPLDLLDVVILGDGGGAATSDMIMDAMRLTETHWVRAAEDRRGSAAAFDADVELASEWVTAMEAVSLPRSVQARLFGQLKQLPGAARRVRMMTSIARMNAASATRLFLLDDVVSRLSSTLLLGVGSCSCREDIDADAMEDAADALLPRVKAWEIAAGVPLFAHCDVVAQCPALFRATTAAAADDGDAREGQRRLAPALEAGRRSDAA